MLAETGEVKLESLFIVLLVLALDPIRLLAVVIISAFSKSAWVIPAAAIGSSIVILMMLNSRPGYVMVDWIVVMHVVSGFIQATIVYMIRRAIWNRKAKAEAEA